MEDLGKLRAAVNTNYHGGIGSCGSKRVLSKE